MKIILALIKGIFKFPFYFLIVILLFPALILSVVLSFGGDDRLIDWFDSKLPH